MFGGGVHKVYGYSPAWSNYLATLTSILNFSLICATDGVLFFSLVSVSRTDLGNNLEKNVKSRVLFTSVITTRRRCSHASRIQFPIELISNGFQEDGRSSHWSESHLSFFLLSCVCFGVLLHFTRYVSTDGQLDRNNYASPCARSQIIHSVPLLLVAHACRVPLYGDIRRPSVCDAPQNMPHPLLRTQ
jgi:hypothetical protein